jgi:hypothetical protein
MSGKMAGLILYRSPSDMWPEEERWRKVLCWNKNVITATADKNVITATEDRVYEVVTRKKN